MKQRALEGKNIIVAGGAGGIASEWCAYFAAQGANLLVNDAGFEQDDAEGGDYDLTKRSNKPADSVVARIEASGGKAAADYEDVSDFEAAGRTVRHCIDEFGSVDALVNTTCVSRLNECVDMTPRQWDEVIKNNLYPVFNLTKHVMPHMIKQGFGRLLYTNSTVIRSFWGSVNYAAAYAGVYSFMRCIANEGRPDGITANCIEPTCAGKTGKRPAGLRFLERRARALDIPHQPDNVLLASIPGAETIAPLAAYLLTDEAKDISGQLFGAKGGRYCIFGTLEEKRYIYKDSEQGDWTVDELKKVLPETLGQSLVPLWFERV